MENDWEEGYRNMLMLCVCVHSIASALLWRQSMLRLSLCGLEVRGISISMVTITEELIQEVSVFSSLPHRRTRTSN